MAEEKIGVVIHYWTKLGVAGVKVNSGELNVGDTIHILGHTSDFTQTVESIHVGNDTVDSARAGDEIGIKVSEHAREHDDVYKVTEG
jgi:putative protease